MRFACVHSFTIAAESKEQSAAILADLHRRIAAASARLGIGYEVGFTSGQSQPEHSSTGGTRHD